MTADQNREIVQKIYACFGAQDLPGILALQAEYVVWHFPGAPSLPYAGEYRGKDGVTEFFGKLRSTAAFEAFEVADLTADDHRVVVTDTERVRSNATGKVAVNAWAMHWTRRDGLVVSMASYEDTAALAEVFSA